MSHAFLSRIILRKEASVRALACLLLPNGKSGQHRAAHHLLWTLFGDDPERERDFLWRQVEKGEFIVLSAREPVDQHNLFRIQTKPFSPAVQKDDRLNFLLRVNATIDRKTPDHKRSRRHDVVMDALYHISKSERTEKRPGLLCKAAEEWLQRRGSTSGFLFQNLKVKAYDVLRVLRPDVGNYATFGVMDLNGELTVTDPEIFVPSLLKGFGRARAFGCGLMLIRRAI
ncbi:type I-E CRISPR-associated protein Cas6/Cse3/CasE [Entomobacter blattae]|uniref:CRISPR associated protein n=1 Tax=Entomobacter blattae TaxID=2762277 RepID=A0A7H1NU60_9PROT|nr:type I-E CRISPR-associated protein Cas6/Cse3/CasE [Entomobacter blattae]QNT79320.1 CRISPR associated protein [Entomobacter blattae]